MTGFIDESNALNLFDLFELHLSNKKNLYEKKKLVT